VLAPDKKTAGYDKYTLASLICLSFPLLPYGGKLDVCHGGKAIFNELFFLFFALVFISSCQRSLFNCHPLVRPFGHTGNR